MSYEQTLTSNTTSATESTSNTITENLSFVGGRNAKLYEFTNSITYTEKQDYIQVLSDADAWTKLIGINPDTRGAQTIPNAKAIVLANKSSQTIELRLSVKEWVGGTPDTYPANTSRYVMILLGAGEFFYLPTVQMVAYDAANSAAKGGDIDNFGVSSSDRTVLDAGKVSSGTDTNGAAGTDDVVDVTDGDYFRVGDYIRITNEIMKVTSISTNALTCERGLLGGTAATSHADETDVFFHIVNHKYDYDNTSLGGAGNGSATLTKTDGNGDYECSTFFGKARNATQTGDGIVRGSVAIKFYTAPYQCLGLTNITSDTDTGLTVGTGYRFDFSVSGQNMTVQFTTDSTNVNWGGTNGVISKIQAAIDANASTDGRIVIEDGDIKFYGNNHFEADAVILAAPSSGSGTAWWGEGNIPAVANITAAVGSALPEDTIIDKLTGRALKNVDNFMFDDGEGNLISGSNIQGTGTINYNTGAITIKGAPKNAEFAFSVGTASALAGGLRFDNTLGHNVLQSIAGRSTNQKRDAQVQVLIYN
ncbi:MAG: hypothetical protein Unbinned2514contig1001_37 [Prokaryotic dsDNA virus sp.]|mgnify:FL=1|nr:MAG: hypothetical protein Unbinned2514contig1001_37 [Prokaryotic dsDNA virus sp.]|tara:strand:- start:11384 stop:12985 length:1602 start_codon:yes stop_codon:yes gene_type:complete